MTEHDPAADSADDAQSSETSSDQIVTIALQCQQDYKRWTEESDLAARAACAEDYRQSLEALWEAIAPDLRRVAPGWIRSGMAPDIESLAINMFSYIVFKLPTLSINTNLNVRGLLVTVARRGLIDDYRRSYAVNPRRQSKQQVVSLDDQMYVADEQRSDVEGEAIQKIDGDDVLAAVEKYWMTLDDEEKKIMQLRWQTDPPHSFREIAKQLGSGWAEDAARQRHHRIMNATRKHLRELNLLGEH